MDVKEEIATRFHKQWCVQLKKPFFLNFINKKKRHGMDEGSSSFVYATKKISSGQGRKDILLVYPIKILVRCHSYNERQKL